MKDLVSESDSDCSSSEDKGAYVYVLVFLIGYGGVARSIVDSIVSFFLFCFANVQYSRMRRAKKI